MTNQLAAVLMASLFSGGCAASLDGDEEDRVNAGNSAGEGCYATVAAPPGSLGIDAGFYSKYLDGNGIPIVAHQDVSDTALVLACEIIGHMVSERPDVLSALRGNDVRVAVLGENQVLTQLPEFAFLSPDLPNPVPPPPCENLPPNTPCNWNTRARGVGATHAVPVTVAPEENLLGTLPDLSHGESIAVHEFGHTLFDLGVADADSMAQSELFDLYTAAMAAGTFGSSYATTDEKEYWAVGVQAWYNVASSYSSNGITTRAELWSADPGLAALVESVLPDDNFAVPVGTPHGPGSDSGGGGGNGGSKNGGGKNGGDDKGSGDDDDGSDDDGGKGGGQK